jgi:hypothetical protein
MRAFGVIPKSETAAVRVQAGAFHGVPVIDIREHFARPGDSEAVHPTKKGVSLSLHALPSLERALRAAGAEALRSGTLSPVDYERLGLEPPQILVTAA